MRLKSTVFVINITRKRIFIYIYSLFVFIFIHMCVFSGFYFIVTT